MRKVASNTLRPNSPTMMSDPVAPPVEQTKKNEVKSLRDCYVLPFNINSQYFLHMLFHMTPEDALVLAWVKYALLNAVPNFAKNIRSEYTIPVSEVVAIADKMGSKVNASIVYSGNLDSKTHTGIYAFVESVQMVVTEGWSHNDVLNKLNPQYLIRSGVTLGTIADVALDAAPVAGILLGLQREVYEKKLTDFYTTLEKLHDVSLDAHYRKLVYYRPYVAISRVAIVDIRQVGKLRLGIVHSLLANLKSKKVYMGSGKPPTETSTVVNVLIDCMQNDVLVNMLPIAIVHGFAKIAMRAYATGSATFVDEDEDPDIISCYVLAAAVLKKISPGDNVVIKLMKRYEGKGVKVYETLASEIFIPILGTSKGKMKFLTSSGNIE
jgi:hypothetical protein